MMTPEAIVLRVVLEVKNGKLTPEQGTVMAIVAGALVVHPASRALYVSLLIGALSGLASGDTKFNAAVSALKAVSPEASLREMVQAGANMVASDRASPLTPDEQAAVDALASAAEQAGALDL